MRVSIITPSFNQAEFLEQAIQSVLSQSYRAIEYILIDGGSTDGSIEIIQKYQNRFLYWHSRKDRGHWDAVHQGFQRATGDILYFLNSDDLLLDQTVERVVDVFQKHPEVGLIYGKAKLIDSAGYFIQDYPSSEFDLQHIFQTWENPVPQPSAFLRKEVFQEFGSPDEAWPFTADFEYWIRISSKIKFLYLPEYFSSMRLHSETKTSRIGDVHAKELIQLCRHYTKTNQLQAAGVDPELALQGAYYRASMHFRRAGKKMKALQSYFAYCRSAFSPPAALYRFCRYTAGLVLNRW